MQRFLISGFQDVVPPFFHEQAQALKWLSEGHAIGQKADPWNGEEFREKSARIEKLLNRFGAGPEQVSRRGTWLSDYSHRDWPSILLFKGADERMEFLASAQNRVFEEFYPEGNSSPDALIHVSCTGYVAPSAAQTLVSKRGWGAQTEVTHAYHMGCYASVPAIRIACGYLSSGALRADVAHTEFCTLHLDLRDASPEQLVIQSLFADGAIRYSVRKECEKGPAFEVLAVLEEVIPESREAMTWSQSSLGMRMTLSQQVPRLLGARLRGFSERLLRRAGIPDAEESMIYAIHPGGPKIIDQVAAILELRENQVSLSRELLRERGNMSSATLPYIWKKVLEDPGTPAGATVLSLAFGPGLTVAGAILKKVEG